MSITTFGETVKQLRLKKKLPQRKVAALLDIDTSVLSKYERNIRKPPKELIENFAKIFNVDSKILFFEATTDKFAYQFVEENLDSIALRVAKNKAAYIKSKRKTSKNYK
ncbi:MAG: helix-turn-helix domain-containing protein [Candidatus Azobacteroides sp.]|nr:helix-turn-helix domain-containing protein [Candidatus Azobacteroides sp.]